jgi:hypothetical protein
MKHIFSAITLLCTFFMSTPSLGQGHINEDPTPKDGRFGKSGFLRIYESDQPVDLHSDVPIKWVQPIHLSPIHPNRPSPNDFLLSEISKNIFFNYDIQEIQPGQLSDRVNELQKIHEVALLIHSPTPEDLKALSGIESLKCLCLLDCRINDLQFLSSLDSLEALSLSFYSDIPEYTKNKDSLKNGAELSQATMPIDHKELFSESQKQFHDCMNAIMAPISHSPASLKGIEGCTSLKCLILYDADKILSLEEIKELKTLRSLSLHYCVNVKNVTALSELPNLETLCLEGMPFVDDLEPLTNLDNLFFLTLLGLPEINAVPAISYCEGAIAEVRYCKNIKTFSFEKADCLVNLSVRKLSDEVDFGNQLYRKGTNKAGPTHRLVIIASDLREDYYLIDEWDKKISFVFPQRDSRSLDEWEKNISFAFPQRDSRSQEFVGHNITLPPKENVIGHFRAYETLDPLGFDHGLESQEMQNVSFILWDSKNIEDSRQQTFPIGLLYEKKYEFSVSNDSDSEKKLLVLPSESVVITEFVMHRPNDLSSEDGSSKSYQWKPER